MVLASNNFKSVKRRMTVSGSGNEPVRCLCGVLNEDCRREIETLEVTVVQGDLIS